MTNFAPLKREGCVLVVIDFQEKLLPAIYDFTAVLDRAAKMVTAAHTMNVPVLFTQHYTTGLGQTHEALRKLQPEFSYIEKNIFNSFGVPDFAAKLEALQAKTLVMLGIEAHICLMQTALGALERGYDVHVLADASGSRKAANKEIGLARLRQAGAIISATELTIYEWMVRSDSDDFRALRNLLK